VLIGPGGAGKGTLAAELVAQDPTLWLSRSWTTRQPRPGERERNSYEFVDRATFEHAVERGEFFEWAEFLGNLMGTPIPRPPAGADVLLEIDVQGAEQVLAKRPDATVILLLPPSVEAQAARLAARGDDEEHIARRVETGRQEVVRGRQVASYTVVNDDLRQATGELAAIVDRTRTAASRAATPEDT
jgi:guanylate kinase